MRFLSAYFPKPTGSFWMKEQLSGPPLHFTVFKLAEGGLRLAIYVINKNTTWYWSQYQHLWYSITDLAFCWTFPAADHNPLMSAIQPVFNTFIPCSYDHTSCIISQCTCGPAELPQQLHTEKICYPRLCSAEDEHSDPRARNILARVEHLNYHGKPWLTLSQSASHSHAADPRIHLI